MCTFNNETRRVIIMKSTIGVQELANTIIGKEINHSALQLLNADISELQSGEKMTEKQALRIKAVSQLHAILKEEKSNVQNGVTLRSPGELYAYSIGKAKEHLLLILGVNAKNVVVNSRWFRLDSENLHSAIFRYLSCQPVTGFYAIIKQGETSQLANLKYLADRLDRNGRIIGIRALDFVQINDDDYLSFKEKGWM